MIFSDDFICEIKDKNEIVDVVSNYTCLRKKGRNYVGLCPFHSEKTGSFFVYPESGSFYCFGCNVGGDVITFLETAENFNYFESVKYLCERANMKMPVSNTKEYKKKKVFYDINKAAAKLFFKNLSCQIGQEGLDYLKLRGLKNSTIKNFGIGYAENNRFSLLKDLQVLGFDPEDVVVSNLAVKTSSGAVVSRFYDRVMFPIIDISGNVVAFGGRALHGALPKYLNTSDTKIFKKSENLFLLNIAKKTKKNYVILVEGYMDAVSLMQAGFDNVVASLGTAVTVGQIKLISRYFKKVIVCYDSDEAGRKASLRASQLLRDNAISVQILNIEGCKDPDEFLRKSGEDSAKKFENLIQKSENDIEFKISSLKKKFDLTVDSEKFEFLSECAKVLSIVKDEIELGAYISNLCKETNFPKELFFNQINKSREKYVENSNYKQKNRFLNKNIIENAKIKVEESVISYIMCGIQNSDPNINDVISRLSPEMFFGELNKKVFQIIKSFLSSGAKFNCNSIFSMLEKDEKARLTKITCNFNEKLITKSAIFEYISRIIGEYNRKNLKISQMTPEEIQNYITKCKAGKI